MTTAHDASEEEEGGGCPLSMEERPPTIGLVVGEDLAWKSKLWSTEEVGDGEEEEEEEEERGEEEAEEEEEEEAGEEAEEAEAGEEEKA
jgi:hypothetical protein